MPMPISTKAEKCLRLSECFERIIAGLPSRYASVFAPIEGEEIIGVYHNAPGDSMHELILITDLGIHVAMDGQTSRFIPYSRIAQIREAGSKEELIENVQKRELIITLEDGQLERCPVRGNWNAEPGSPYAPYGGPDFASFHTFLLGARQVRQILDAKS